MSASMDAILPLWKRQLIGGGSGHDDRSAPAEFFGAAWLWLLLGVLSVAAGGTCQIS